MKIMKKLKTNLALLVPVLTILAMALVGCSSNSGGGGGSSSGSGSNGGSSNIAVTGVNITPTSNASSRIDIGKGAFKRLKATVSPSTAINKNVTWKVSPAVTGISIDADGKVSVASSVVLNTSATITVTTDDGGKTDTAYIKVVTNVPTTSVSLNKTRETIYVGGSAALTATVAPSNATNKDVTWKSNNDAVATVNANGTVTAVSVGTAIITVTADDGSHTATATITVKTPILVTGVSLNTSNVTLFTGGDTTTLTATVAPSNATNKAVTWSTSNDAVATVNANGKVTAVSVGTSIITATTNDGSHTATAAITVKRPSPETMLETIPASFTLPAGGIKFPMKRDDSGTGTINHKFSMAQTEVTYELWKKVYDWANKGSNTCQSNGQYCYTFANAGTKGGMYDSDSNSSYGNLAGSDKQPVTAISWRDSIVWCNAYTEWSNATKDTSYTVVYYTDGAYTTPLRTSTNDTVPNPLSGATAGSEDKPYIKASSNGNTSMANNTATGFRLPTSVEWEFAARLRTDATNHVTGSYASGVIIGSTTYYYTKGDSASGAAKDRYDATETGKFAWYNKNSCDDGSGCRHDYSGTKQSKTRDVATKTANALGIYDMSGNVREWCFDISSGSYRVNRGGHSFSGGAWLRVGSVTYRSPDIVHSGFGLRPVRTLP